MKDHARSRVAVGVAAGMMVYLLLSIFAFGVRSAALNMILLPGYFLLVVPTPVLAIFGLSNGGWLVAEPKPLGYVLLIAMYTAAAYFLAGSIERKLHDRSRVTEPPQPPRE